MFCAKCGAENPTGMNFCEKCGASLQDQVSQMVQENTGRKKNLAIAAVCIGVVLLCLIGLLVFINSQKQAQYNEKIQEATRYYQDLDFERAETAYLDAIDIRPKETKAYLDLSDIYIQQGRQEEAIELLEKGQKKTRDKEIETKLEQAKADFDKIESGNSQYKAYYDLCMDYLERYGAAEYVPHGVGAEQGNMTGFSIARLMDFNEDGNMELLLAYSNKGQDGVGSYNVYEVWAWQNNKLVNVLPATKGNHGTDVSNWMAGILLDGTIQLKISRLSEELDEYGYMRYDGKKFDASYESRQNAFGGNSIEESFSIYGEAVTKEEFDAAVADVRDKYFYSREIPYTNSNGEFQIDFWSITKVYADNLLAETERTIELLREKTD